MATTSSSRGHIRKRQYQPSIKSYFNTRDADPNTLSRLPRTASPLSPPVPPETQASLLSVGMRVRKSVPEGYKTHKTLGNEYFQFPSTAPAQLTATMRPSSSGGSTRELMPFCGLHKTGGLAAQDIPSSSAPAALQTDDEGEYGLPGLTMSQPTLPSTQCSFMSSSSGPSRKRTYEEEIEEEIDAYFDELDEADMVVEQQQHVDRPMARVRPTKATPTSSRRVRVVGEDDFEEATFLAPPEGMELDET